ncbi:unnamed protein product [Scytosiphon promiscuus]
MNVAPAGPTRNSNENTPLVTTSSSRKSSAGMTSSITVDDASTATTAASAAGGTAEEARAPLLEEGRGTRRSRRARNTGGFRDDYDDDEGGSSDGALDQADVAYSANSFMAVVKPVTLCMTLSALITVSLYSDAEGATNRALSVYEVYDEADATLDPSSVRLGKSLVNALIIVLVLAAATVVIVWMYWMRCMRCLVGYMAMSSAVLLGVMGGAVWGAALEVFQIPCDAFTYYGVLWNFAVVGVVAIFYQKGIPTTVTQAYLVATSIIMAWQLSRFEEWTGWCLLVVLALYDLCAVLTPCGPLKALVNLMQEYEEPMPGLLYEAELPAGPPRRRRPRPPADQSTAEQGQQPRRQDRVEEPRDEREGDTNSALLGSAGGVNSGAAGGGEEKASAASARGAGGRGGSGDSDGGISRRGDEGSHASRRSTGSAAGGGVQQSLTSGSGSGKNATETGRGDIGVSNDEAATVSPLLELVQPSPSAAAARHAAGRDDAGEARGGGRGGGRSFRSGGSGGKKSGLRSRGGSASPPSRGGGNGSSSSSTASRGFERVPLEGAPSIENRGEGEGARRRTRTRRAVSGDADDEEEEETGVSIKLGLGDFVFYSVLVSKAALYGFTAWAACVVVIVFGLGATLVLLAVYRMALPALPISIGLGTVFYLLTRFSIQPYVEALNDKPLYF